MSKYRVAIVADLEYNGTLTDFEAILRHHLEVDAERDTGIKNLNLEKLEVEELDYPDIKIEDLMKGNK